MRAASGLKGRIGSATLVAVGREDRDAPISLLERSQFITVPPGKWAPYHAAEGLAPDDARRHVEQSVATSYRMAEAAIRQAMERLASSGHGVEACAVLIGTGIPAWTVDEVLAVHVRMHKVEGELFREILRAGAQACRMIVQTIPDKTAFDAAAKVLRTTRARVDAQVAALGKMAGSPWGKDQKEAAVAALVALREPR